VEEEAVVAMLPVSGLVWGRPAAVDGSAVMAAAAAAAGTAGAAAHQPLVYCYGPADLQLPAAASLTYHQQLLQQQQHQQQVVLAAKGLQQQQQPAAATQHVYVQTALGLQACRIPAAAASPLTAAALPLPGTLALSTNNLPAGAYLSPDQLYLPTPAAAAAAATSVALTSNRKVRPFLPSHSATVSYRLLLDSTTFVPSDDILSV